MKKTVILIISLFLVCFALVGCQKNESSKNYVLEFESNPTTGYTWSYEVAEEGLVEVENNYTSANQKEGMVGVGGTNTFTIKGVKEGTTTITFKYARTWESTDADKTETYKITVDKNLNVVGEKVQ